MYVEYNKLLENMGIIIPAGRNAWAYPTLYKRLRTIVTKIRKGLSEKLYSDKKSKNDYTKEFLMAREIENQEDKPEKDKKRESIGRDEEQDILSSSPPTQESISAVDVLTPSSFPFVVEYNNSSYYFFSLQEMSDFLTLARSINSLPQERFQLSPVVQESILTGFENHLLYLLLKPHKSSSAPSP